MKITAANPAAKDVKIDDKRRNMRTAALTDTGLVRTVNEDAYWCDSDRRIFIVADGIGGSQAGDVASTIAVEIISAELTLAVDRGLKDSALTDSMFDAFREAAAEIYGRSGDPEGEHGMACSAIAAVIQNDVCLIAHAGDARGYLYSQNSLLQMTVDDTPVAALVKRGYLLPEKARSHHLKHILTKSLGNRPSVDANLTRFPVKKDEVLLICSDGLWGMLTHEQMTEIFQKYKDPATTCSEFITAALESGGEDNITAIIVEMNPVGPDASDPEPQHTEDMFGELE